MRVLLGSGGFRTEERIQFLRKEMRDFFGDIEELLFVPFALQDHESYVQGMINKGINAGYRLAGIHQVDDPARAVESAKGIFVGGGNTFRLVHDLYRLDLMDKIRQGVQAGLPYLGISAGANIACPTLKTTNDMPIVQPPSFATLNLVSFQLNPHYYSGQNYVKVGEEFVEHFGETRDVRLQEFHEMNETPVIGLWEGGILRIEKGEVLLKRGSARVFLKGKDPEDFEAEANLTALLNSG